MLLASGEYKYTVGSYNRDWELKEEVRKVGDGEKKRKGEWRVFRNEIVLNFGNPECCPGIKSMLTTSFGGCFQAYFTTETALT